MNKIFAAALMTLLCIGAVQADSQKLKFRQDGTFKIVQFADMHWQKRDANDIKTSKLMEEILQVVQSNAQYTSIQAAIDASVDGDIIILAPVTFSGEGNRDLDFNGLAITIRSIDPNDPDIVASTIIDCQGTETEPHRGFYFYSGEGSDSILDGFTITNGYMEVGGGIYCDGSSPEISKCVFSSNNAIVSGGGVYSGNKGNCKITDCMFINNSSNNTGGAIKNNEAGLVKISNCKFIGNSVAGFGGAIDNYLTTSEITNCGFISNSAGDSGAAIHNNAESKTAITNCTFVANSAPKGRALSCSHQDFIISLSSNISATNCIMWDGGDEIYNNDESTITISYSDIQGSWDGLGDNNIDVDPLFADSANGDYHLRSKRGRYWEEQNVWVLDNVSSPCIDAGDLAVNPVDEPSPNGGRGNMGAYGQTPYASMSERAIAGDINRDGLVNMLDFAIMANNWMDCSLWPELGYQNVLDGIKLLHTMIRALEDMNSCLVRMQELAEQSATGSYSSDQRSIMNSEFQELLVMINRLAENTECNGIKMLNDESGVVTINTGSETFEFARINMTTAGLGLDGGLDILTASGAQFALDAVNEAVNLQTAAIETFNDYLSSLLN